MIPTPQTERETLELIASKSLQAKREAERAKDPMAAQLAEADMNATLERLANLSAE